MDEHYHISNSDNVESGDYSHSSNSLFHFMGKPEFLYDAIIRKALVPRYFKEDIGYLGLTLNDKPFIEMAVLAKCFCDIPLHRVTYTTHCSATIDNDSNPTAKQFDGSHTTVYGEYSIAFSKSWGEKHGVNPVNYHNPDAEYSKKLQVAINDVISGKEIVPDSVTDNYMLLLAYLKPLRGQMKRIIGVGKIDTIHKNFYDEQEWRFVPAVPSANNPRKSPFDVIIASYYLLNEDIYRPGDSAINNFCKELCDSKNRSYWLRFEYNDIRYIIVPNNQERLQLIQWICDMDASAFTIGHDRYILISKILVLNEIGRDM